MFLKDTIGYNNHNPLDIKTEINNRNPNSMDADETASDFYVNHRVTAIKEEEAVDVRPKQQSRKRCDTWHGGNSGDHQERILDPSISEGLNTKRKFARKNPWGYCSYADLITMALERAPDRQLTLSEIYEWIVANIPYFYDKGDANSSIGWKNSIRHNLSLHEKFTRVPQGNTSSTTRNIGAYWTLVDEADVKETTKISMSPPPIATQSPPANFRKRSSTMPTNMNHHRSKTSRMIREKRTPLSAGAFDLASMEGDSGIERLSRHSSVSSLHVTDDFQRINLDSYSNGGSNSNSVIAAGSVKTEGIDSGYNRHNRSDYIDPSNSVLVEVRLTAEQYEMVRSGKYIVSLCEKDQVVSAPVKLPYWKTTAQKSTGTSGGTRHAFSPTSEQGMMSYSPPGRTFVDSSRMEHDVAVRRKSDIRITSTSDRETPTAGRTTTPTTSTNNTTGTELTFMNSIQLNEQIFGALTDLHDYDLAELLEHN